MENLGVERGPALNNARQEQSRLPEGLNDEISNYSEQGGRRAKEAGEAQFSQTTEGLKPTTNENKVREDRELLQALCIFDA